MQNKKRISQEGIYKRLLAFRVVMQWKQSD